MIAVAVVLTTILNLGTMHTQEPLEVQYEEFMALSKERRMVRFAGLDPVNKARIMRAHAERWLEQHRRRLSRRQVALVEKAIAFLTPGLYRTPRDVEIERRSKALEGELRCGLRHSDMLEAFDPLRSPVSRASWLDDMWNWLELCFFTDGAGRGLAETVGEKAPPTQLAVVVRGIAEGESPLPVHVRRSRRQGGAPAWHQRHW